MHTITGACTFKHLLPMLDLMCNHDMNIIGLKKRQVFIAVIKRCQSEVASQVVTERLTRLSGHFRWPCKHRLSEMNSPYLTVISNDTRPKVQGDVNQEERIREHIESLPAHAAFAVQESNLHGDPNQV